MRIAHLIVVGVFALFGLGVLSTGVTALRADGSRIGMGMVFGGIAYLAGAYFGYALNSWWPFLAAFGVAWIARLVLGEPGWNR